MKVGIKLAPKSEEVKRIAFQPTAENRKKLLKITENNGVSISAIINLLLDDLDINAKVEMHIIKNKTRGEELEES